MKREQLVVIAGLFVELDVINELLSDAKNFRDVWVRPRKEMSTRIFIEAGVIEPTLIARKDKIKAELKKMGFEAEED
jgi:hypothetical protein